MIQQPPDHVLFLKQILDNAAKCRDVSRVILISTPKVNTVEVANHISRQTGHVVLTEENIMNCFDRVDCLKLFRSISTSVFCHFQQQKFTRKDLTPKQISKCLSYLVRTGNAYQSGWIMAGVFKSAAEAKELLLLGILPTHVIHLVPPYDPPLDELLYCHVSESWPEHRRTIVELRSTFRAKLMVSSFSGKRGRASF